MDSVYRDAHVILSLLDCWAEDKFAAPALKALAPPTPTMDMSIPGILQFVRKSDIRDFLPAAESLVHILEFIAADRWLMRAWILQERLCSMSHSGSNELWFMCSLGLPTATTGEMALDATNFDLVMPALFDELEQRNKTELRKRLEAAY